MVIDTGVELARKGLCRSEGSDRSAKPGWTWPCFGSLNREGSEAERCSAHGTVSASAPRGRLSGRLGGISRENSPRPDLRVEGRSCVMIPSVWRNENTNLWDLFCSVLFCKFIQSIPDNQLVRQKLNCMTKIVESNLFRQSGMSSPKTTAYRHSSLAASPANACFFFFFPLNVNNDLASSWLGHRDLLRNWF